MHRAQHEGLVRSGGGSPPGATRALPRRCRRPGVGRPATSRAWRLSAVSPGCDRDESGVRCEVRAPRSRQRRRNPLLPRPIPRPEQRQHRPAMRTPGAFPPRRAECAPALRSSEMVRVMPSSSRRRGAVRASALGSGRLRGRAPDRQGMLGAASWREPTGRVVPVAASTLHAGNDRRTPGSTGRAVCARRRLRRSRLLQETEGRVFPKVVRGVKFCC